MKTITFDHINLNKPDQKSDRRDPRNQKEDLIEMIVTQCHHRHQGDARKLRKLLAIAANTGGWTTTDLHALLRKRESPWIRNYTAFVWWSAKIRRNDVKG